MCILSNDRLTNSLSLPLCVTAYWSTLVNLFASAGLSGSAPLAIGGGSVADLFSETERASAMALYNFGPLLGMLTMFSCILKANNIVLGPALGPAAGGFIAERLGIKWVFIVIAGSPITSSIPRSANILGLFSYLWCCKYHRNPFLEGNLRACHPTETRSAFGRPRSHSRCNSFT